jgi:hypothetical protein
MESHFGNGRGLPWKRVLEAQEWVQVEAEQGEDDVVGGVLPPERWMVSSQVGHLGELGLPLKISCCFLRAHPCTGRGSGQGP